MVTWIEAWPRLRLDVLRVGDAAGHPGNTAGGGLIVPSTGFMTTVPALPPGVYQVRVIGRTAAGAFVGTFSDALSLTIQ